MKRRIALAGTPNCGKTTLFNLITGSRAATGNWAGVTVQKKSAVLKADPRVEVNDLPGVYSLSPYSPEERVTGDFLKSGGAEALVCVIDATNPEHGVYLALELRSLKIPMVLAVNFADELHKAGGSADLVELEKAFGCPAFLISAKSGKGVAGLVSAILRPLAAKIKPFPALSEQERHRLAGKISETCFKYPRRSAPLMEKLDAFLTENRFSVLVLILLMLTTFLTVFGWPGAILKNLVDVLFEKLAFSASGLLSALGVSHWLTSLIVDGIIGGVGSVMSFLPQTTLMFFVISLLEDSGYMARAAFVSDRALRRFGLGGRSIIPLLMGFGCTVPAVLAAKSNPSEKERVLTVSILPFISCSAKLPLYLFFTAELFPEHRATAVVLIYLVGVIFAGLYCLINRPKSAAGFILELPPCRAPSLKSIVKSTFIKCHGFVAKAGTVVLTVSMAIWVLSYFGPGFSPAMSIDESLIAVLGRFIAPLFKPIGLGWRAVVPLFCGLAAKEAALSTLFLLTGGDLSAAFTPAETVSFLIFFVLYSPCFAALSAIKQELGAKRAVRIFLFQTALAYFISFIFYTAATLIAAL